MTVVAVDKFVLHILFLVNQREKANYDAKDNFSCFDLHHYSETTLLASSKGRIDSDLFSFYFASNLDTPSYYGGVGGTFTIRHVYEVMMDTCGMFSFSTNNSKQWFSFLFSFLFFFFSPF
jgi:hypothetical protein